MNRTLSLLKQLIAVVLLTAPLSAFATPIAMQYDIGPYGTSGYSASWLHAATGCTGQGPGSGQTVYMCGAVEGVTGSILGTHDNGVLSITGGSLNIGGISYAILSGQLGGAFVYGSGDQLSSWFIELEGLGTFYFEGFDMGSGKPNNFSIDEFFLWGQNYDAYFCPVGSTTCTRWGIDLYGKSVPVPEPATLLLFALGLLGLGFVSSRKKKATA